MRKTPEKNKASSGLWSQGIHSVKALLTQRPEEVQELFVQSGRQDLRLKEIIKLAHTLAIKVQQVSSDELDRLVSDTQHQGVIAAVHAPKIYTEDDLHTLLEASKTPPLVLILDGIQDPHNLGACLRTADAAGVCCVIIPKDRAAPLNATVRKVACGATETVPLISVTNLARTLATLKEAGVWLIGAAGEASQPVYDCDFKGSVGIVMGAEGEGLRRLTREHCDFLTHIPMHGHVESLNVSVATGIFLFEALRQRTP